MLSHRLLVVEENLMGNGTRRSAALFAIIACSLLSLGMNQCSSVITVRNGESIQDAVDLAQPGDTIVVRAGLYTASGGSAVVEVMKDDITLIGNRNAVIDATGVPFGVRVGAPVQGDCLAGVVKNFKIVGFTIQNAGFTGLQMVNVDGYTATGGTYLDNEEYGPFPVCSTNGTISHNFASGHNDAAIYVGQSDGAVVEFNTVVDSVIGIELENTSNVVVRNNQLRDNTAGMLVVVLPGLFFPFTENILITENIVDDNNRANTAGGGFLSLLPVGSGILNVGGDNVVIQKNVVQRNDSFGVASIGNFFFLLDPRIEPFVDGLEVRDNVILQNGANRDPVSFTPGADIVFVHDVFDPTSGTFIVSDPDPSDNCFQDNVFNTDFPPGIVGLFPCP